MNPSSRPPSLSLSRMSLQAWALASAVLLSIAPAARAQAPVIPSAASAAASAPKPGAPAASAPLVASAASAASAPSGPAFSLGQLLALAQQSNPALAAERSRVAGAQAGVRTARAMPNPDLEWLGGKQRASVPGAPEGRSQSWSVTQPIELPGLRRARSGAAEAELAGVRAGVGAFEHALLAQLKLRYYTVLRLQAESRNAEQDVALAEQIHARVKVRVGTGESPRYELIRAEAERLNTQRALQAAVLRVQQGRAELRRLVGPTLPTEFSVIGQIEDAAPPPPSVQALRSRLLERHPELVAARAELRAAESRLQLEKERRLPSLALRASSDREPDIRANRVGVVLTVPLFDRREGPIGEAQATVLRQRSSIADRELQLGQALDIAWQQYQIALGQVAAYESGIVRQAEAALNVAEAAYRYGERGILEYLDAQRVWRLARNELNAARYDLRAALVELERLGAEMGIEPAPDTAQTAQTTHTADTTEGVDNPTPRVATE